MKSRSLIQRSRRFVFVLVVTTGLICGLAMFQQSNSSSYSLSETTDVLEHLAGPVDGHGNN